MHGTLDRDSSKRVACVVDLDNILARRRKFGKYARALLDLYRFKAVLEERGVSEGVVFQNQRLGIFESKIWRCLGFSTVSTRNNVDDAVKIAAIDFALDGVDTMIICASDGGYCDTIQAIRECDIKVEVWCLRDAVCRKLLFVADQVFWMDHLVVEPTANAGS